MKKRTRPFKESGVVLFKTRLCLKNLPTNVTSSQLQAFLKTRLPTLNITDAKVLQTRQMAFVGVSTEAEAQSLIHEYNRAYFQTSRITVENAVAPKNIAKDEVAKEHAAKETKASQSNIALENQKHAKPDRHKQEYLSVMGAGKIDAQPKKSWANDYVGGADEMGECSRSKQEYAPLDEESHDDLIHSNVDDSSSASDEDSANPLDKQQPRQSSASDLDFLRSKTVLMQELDDTEIAKESVRGASHSSSISKDDVDLGEDVSDSSSTDATSSCSKQDTSKVVASPDRDDFDTRNVADRHDKKDLCRLFLRNLPFVTNTDDVFKLFESYSPVDVHLPVDDQKNSKGFGFVTLASAADTQKALADLDGVDFQGRLLHILPAKSSQVNSATASDVGHLNYKQKQELLKRQEAMKSTTGWSASYLRGDAVIDTLAERLGLRKSHMLNVKDGMSGGDAAVRLALGETALIEENRKYFTDHGIDMEALVSAHHGGGTDEKAAMAAAALISRSKTSILVKNLPADTTEAELMKVFGTAGESPNRILLPPSRTIAVVEYSHMNDAKSAFKRLAYKRFKSVPLYLEWAPVTASKGAHDVNCLAEEDIPSNAVTEDVNDIEDDTVGPTLTVFVKNLNFGTSEERLGEFLSAYANDIRTIRIPKKLAPTRRNPTSSLPGDAMKELSLGYGFVEFRSNQTAQKAIKQLNGTILDGHALELMLSKNAKADSRRESRPTTKSAKLMIRNVPFQADRRELMQLFGSFGQLKNVRLPKKFAGGHRGFCFIEYLTPKEAAAAMAALSRTHLYGRHLVIEWATADDDANGLPALRVKAERDVDHEPRRENKRIRFS